MSNLYVSSLVGEVVPARFQAPGQIMGLQNDTSSSSTTGLSATVNQSGRSCARGDCSRTMALSGSPENTDLCEECVAGIRLRKPLSTPTNGGGSAMSIFTPTGEYPCELDVNLRLQRWEGIAIGPTPPSSELSKAAAKPMAPSRMSRYSALLSSNYCTPQPSHFNSRGEVIFATIGRVPIDGDHNLSGVTHQPAYPPTAEQLPRNCAQCQVSIPRLLSDKLCGSCRIRHTAFDANQLETDNSSSEPPNATPPSSLNAKEVIDLTHEEPTPVIKEGINPASTSETDFPLKVKPPPSPNESDSDQIRPTRRRRIGECARDSTSSLERLSECSLPKTGGKHDGIQRNKPTWALRLCSTPGCAGYISAESCTSRCIDCVKLEWKRRKEHLNSVKSCDPRDSGDPQAMGENPTPYAESKFRKSVTWADMVTEASEDGEVIQRPAWFVKDDNFEQSSGSNDGPQLHETKGDKAPQSTVCVDGFSRIPDWDSDRSDLTDTNESDSSAKARTSAPTSLKIRIPARPKIIYNRKCKNPTCSQLLATTYPRETCVVCRARKHRRRRRQQNPHFWQDWSGENLLSDQETLVPLDFLQKNGIHRYAVPNARVCSMSGCNYIIAPHEEYNWKTCGLCRLYKRERRMARKQEINSVESTLQAKRLFSLYENLPTRPPGQGRCRSADCGFLVDDGSIICRQCVPRRGKLMRKAGIFDEKIDITSETARNTGSEIASYPQYKCFTVLLTDFEDRLSTFLKSQTIFFLFKARYVESSLPKALFAFDGEYSVVTLDFDILGRKTTIDNNSLKLKKEFERVGRINFAPKRVVSVLEGGGVAIRFTCSYRASILYPVKEDDIAISESMKPMKGELEIAVFPDRSHRFLPGEKTIIRFRLFG